MVTRSMVAVAGAVFAVAATCAFAQEQKPVNYKDFEVHDRTRPLPPKVEPGTASTQERVGTAPSDAVVLFDGKDLSKWVSVKGGEAKWDVRDGYVQIPKGAGAIQTKESFGDCQLHIEWMSPEDAKGKDQLRANSGVFFMGMYEVQVLDTFENKTYPDGMAGSMYGQYPPLVNAARPAGQWQTYDIIFHKPIYKDGKVEKPATLTILFNGVVVQDHTPSLGPTKHKELANYPAKHPETGPIQLQDHGDPVKFRNIWVRPLPSADERPQPAVKPAGAGYERR